MPRWAFPLRAGRGLTAADAEGSLPVVVVNEALATLLGGRTAARSARRVIIGRGTPAASAPREIVGVVPNVADGRPGTRLFPTMYLPRTQFASGGSVMVLVRTTGTWQIAPELRRAITAIDADAPDRADPHDGRSRPGAPSRGSASTCC